MSPRPWGGCGGVQGGCGGAGWAQSGHRGTGWACSWGLTSLLHEAEEVVQELLPPGVTIQLVQLHKKKREMLRNPLNPCVPPPETPSFH